MTKQIGLGIVAFIALLGIGASVAHAQARFCSVRAASDQPDQVCRDVDGNIMGIGKLFSGSSSQIRAKLVSGTNFGAIGIGPDGNFNFGCEVTDVRPIDEFPAVAFSPECADATTFLMQGQGF